MEPLPERYARNIPAISAAEQRSLREKRVLIAGCGGLGGYLLESLCRVGVGAVTVVDGDRVSASNLNRQILATERTLGISKVLAAKERAAAINPKVRIEAVETYLDAGNAGCLVAGADLVLDALDSVPARLLLEQTCAELGVVLVHGAVDGWCSQVAVVPPGFGMLRRVYRDARETPDAHTCVSAVPQFCAALQSAQAVAQLCGRQSPLYGRLLVADLQSMTWHIIPGEQL